MRPRGGDDNRLVSGYLWIGKCRCCVAAHFHCCAAKVVHLRKTSFGSGMWSTRSAFDSAVTCTHLFDVHSQQVLTFKWQKGSFLNGYPNNLWTDTYKCFTTCYSYMVKAALINIFSLITGLTPDSWWTEHREFSPEPGGPLSSKERFSVFQLLFCVFSAKALKTCSAPNSWQTK